MNVVLTSVDNTPSLLHFRTKGSKNGVRLYQYEDGSLTPLGRIHYGVGKGREKGEPEKSDRQKEKELKANISNKIKQFSENREAEAKARTDEKEAEEKKRIDKQKNIYKMSDQELDKKIERLQKEELYSDLLKKQSARGKKQHPMREAIGQMLGEAAKRVARQSLNDLVDQVIARSKAKNAIKLSDYKDIDPYSLSSDKLKAVSDAFNTAANLVRNKYVVDHEGRNPNDNNNQNQNNNQQKKNQNDNPQPKQQNNDKPVSDNKSKKQEKKEKQEAKQKEKQKNKQQDRVEAMARSGKTFEEIAKSLHISEAMVYKYLEDLV